jgi:hypothetical protein
VAGKCWELLGIRQLLGIAGDGVLMGICCRRISGWREIAWDQAPIIRVEFQVDQAPISRVEFRVDQAPIIRVEFQVFTV